MSVPVTGYVGYRVSSTPFSGIVWSSDYPNLVLSLSGGGFLGGIFLGVNISSSWIIYLILIALWSRYHAPGPYALGRGFHPRWHHFPAFLISAYLNLGVFFLTLTYVH